MCQEGRTTGLAEFAGRTGRGGECNTTE